MQKFRIILFFWWTTSGFVFIPSAVPQRAAYSEVPSQMAAHLRVGGLRRFEPGTASLRSGVVPMNNNYSLYFNFACNFSAEAKLLTN